MLERIFRAFDHFGIHLAEDLRMILAGNRDFLRRGSPLLLGIGHFLRGFGVFLFVLGQDANRFLHVVHGFFRNLTRFFEGIGDGAGSFFRDIAPAHPRRDMLAMRSSQSFGRNSSLSFWPIFQPPMAAAKVPTAVVSRPTDPTVDVIVMPNSPIDPTSGARLMPSNLSELSTPLKAPPRDCTCGVVVVVFVDIVVIAVPVCSTLPSKRFNCFSAFWTSSLNWEKSAEKDAVTAISLDSIPQR